MYTGRLIFSQLMDHLPMPAFRRCVERYQGDRWVKSFSWVAHYRCMAFAQLTYRESLRDIEACLRAQGAKLYHMDIRGAVSRSTLADANEQRDWRIYADFAQRLIHTARRLYVDDALALELDDMPSTPQPSVCVSRFSLGPPFAGPTRRSRCTRFSTCAAPSPPSSTSPTASSTTSTCWTC